MSTNKITQMTKFFTLVLFICLSWGQTVRKISGYDKSNNSFFCEDTSKSNISTFSFINSLKDVSNSKQIKNRKLRKCIAKYAKASKKSNEMVILYHKGRTHENGRIIVEDLNLINNVKYWYYVGGVLSALIIAPYLPDLLSFLRFLFDGELEGEEDDPYSSLEDEEHEDELNKRITGLGKKTFLPGLAIISIGYIGQNIKIGQKKTLIKKSDTLYPIISKYFSADELEEAIRIYNNL